MKVLEVIKSLEVANQNHEIKIMAEDDEGDAIFLDLEELDINKEIGKIYFTIDKDYVIIPKDELERLQKNQRES